METIPAEVTLEAAGVPGAVTPEAVEVPGAATPEEIVVAGDWVVILNNNKVQTVTMVVDTDKMDTKEVCTTQV